MGMKMSARRLLAATGVACAVVLGGVATAGSASAASWTPDSWLYCYNTVPAGQTTKISYAGIYARPYYNSPRTTCRDLVQNQWFYWYSSRPINWSTACRMTYGSGWAYTGGDGRIYCAR